jgi:hypothetical protein
MRASVCMNFVDVNDGGGFVGRKADGLDSVAIASAAKPT